MKLIAQLNLFSFWFFQGFNFYLFMGDGKNRNKSKLCLTFHFGTFYLFKTKTCRRFLTWERLKIWQESFFFEGDTRVSPPPLIVDRRSLGTLHSCTLDSAMRFYIYSRCISRTDSDLFYHSLEPHRLLFDSCL